MKPKFLPQICRDNCKGCGKHEELGSVWDFTLLIVDTTVCSYLADFYFIWDDARIKIFTLGRNFVKTKSMAKHFDNDNNMNDDNNNKVDIYCAIMD